jgi:hypothetical protein
MKAIIILSIILLIISLIKFQVVENAYFNIPTRFCKPTRFHSPYDYRGLVDVPLSIEQIPFEQSEGIGENYKYCYDEFQRTLD